MSPAQKAPASAAGKGGGSQSKAASETPDSSATDRQGVSSQTTTGTAPQERTDVRHTGP